MKPVVAISLGDPYGISPEIIARSLKDAISKCQPVIFGHWPSLEPALKQVSLDIEVDLVEDLNEVDPKDTEHICVVPCHLNKLSLDSQDRRSGQAQLIALERATDAVLNGTCNALVTAPVAKNLVATCCPGFTGHTEYLARRANLRPDEVTMVFVRDTLAVGLVTTHLPLKDVPAAITRPRLERTLRHLVEVLSPLHPEGRLRIGVAGLNPHAGEEGIIGTEDGEIIEPFCRDLECYDRVELVGPLPAETLFRDAFKGYYHGVIAAYHDQAMIPLKLTSIGELVNVTVGLPFMRTSPGHGVAYDIANLNKADPSSMKRAIGFAARFA